MVYIPSHWKQCSQCDKYKRDVKLRIDPYIADVENREVMVLLCDDCEELLGDEI